MKSNRLITFLLLPALICILINCSQDNQTTNAPTSLPEPMFTPASVSNNPTPTESLPKPKATEPLPAPTATVMKSSTPSPTPTRIRKPTFTPVITDNVTVLGTIKFQVEAQKVVTAAELGQSSIVGPSLIETEDGHYRLYIQARAEKNNENMSGVNILSLISDDGINWNYEPGIRISHGADSDVDAEAGEPGVYLGPDNKYHMAYTGRFMGKNKAGKDQKMHRVVFAMSEDGLTWTKLNQHYSDPENINDFASSAEVTIIDGEYVIYYTGQRNIIRATSDDGLSWNREEIAFKTGHDSTMIKIDDTYYMFWNMPPEMVYGRNPDTKQDVLFMALSSDGVHWSRDYYQLAIEKPDGSKLAAQEIQDPGAILIADGSLRIFLNDLGGKSIYSIKPMTTLPKLDP
ncbi:MAG: hypothetical protein FI727_01760 [SAR202 cluster bacterium]|nr:hypothetical protein [SAR202 cluster bacterium]